MVSNALHSITRARTRWVACAIVATLLFVTLLPASRVLLAVRTIAGVGTVLLLFVIHRAQRRRSRRLHAQLDEIANRVTDMNQRPGSATGGTRRIH